MPRAPRTTPRNNLLAKGVHRYSRSVSFHRKGKWAIKNKKPVDKKVVAASPKVKTFGKRNEKRTILAKAPRVYPVDGAEHTMHKKTSATTHRATLKKSITPGSVLILLAGRFRGKRVVFLKQLASGLLLVTGPYKLNGVPLRRVNQSFTISTSAKVDLTGAKVDEKFNDAYFAKAEKAKKQKTEEQFFAQQEKKKQIDKHRIEDQKAFDKQLLENIKKTPHLSSYLAAPFSLKRGQFPHPLKF